MYTILFIQLYVNVWPCDSSKVGGWPPHPPPLDQSLHPVHIELPYMMEPLDLLACHFSAVVVGDDSVENMWMGWHIE